ncbi:MAG: tryptophan synthase subunit alpha [Candidatus Bathyarchaeota archaeon]|nr:MAG: tryptophan synthase subunit alpha [Candidatus Bathyarchaeota archaeon]
MRTIENAFHNLRQKREGALLAYITGGDPEPSYTPEIATALIEGGADIIELGIPFSDPIADGPTIQAATTRALRSGTTPKMVLQMAREVKNQHNIPIAILTYYNSIFSMGLKSFCAMAKTCNVDGIIVPDLPVEEAQNFKKVAEEQEIDTIFLAAPSTQNWRLQKIIEYTSGFLYLVSLYGVTGIRTQLQTLTLQTIARILPYTKNKIPLAVGFGLSEPKHVKTVIQSGVDGVIVGSAFVKIIEANKERSNLFESLKTKAAQLKLGTLYKTT